MRDALWSRVDPTEAQIVAEYTQNFPVKVGALATSLGLIVTRTPMEPRISGKIQPSSVSESGFEIKVNKYEIKERQRFTVAHEIAHFLLHRAAIGAGVTDNTLYRSTLTSQKEAEANRLAADIIMPSGLISQQLSVHGGVANDRVAVEMAFEFDVSLPAMRIRLGIT